MGSKMLTALRRLWGHDSIGPSCVLDQSIMRINWPISPPPTNQSWVGKGVFFVGRLYRYAWPFSVSNGAKGISSLTSPQPHCLVTNSLELPS